MLIETNHTPIISPATRTGASFVIALNPTGLRHSSPIVCNRYVAFSHHMDTSTPPDARTAPAAITANPSPPNSSPNVNFDGLDGSRRPICNHIHANTGASATTNTGCTN